MAKVEIINSYSPNRAAIKPLNTKKYSPHFTGTPVSQAPKFTNYLKQKRLINFMEKLKWFDGEQGRILITAIGTGAIAPLFIAWNPYVKPKEGATEEEKQELKKTQKYTAMRQPISAALAIPIQMSLVSPIEKGLDVLFNNQKFAKHIPNYLNKSALQDDKYIERQEKKKLKASGLGKKELKEQLAKNTEAVANEQISKVAKGLLADGQIRIAEGAKGLVDNKSVAEALRNAIRGYASDANFLRYDSITDEELTKIFDDPSASISEINKGKDFYVQRAETLTKNESDLTKVLQTNLPKDKAKITEYLQQHIATIQDKELKKVYQEIIDLGDKEAQASRAARTIERINTIKKACGDEGKFTKEKYLQHMKENEAELLKRIKKFAEICKGLEENPQSIKKTIEELAKNCSFDRNDKNLNKIFHDISTFGENAEKLKEKICRDVVKGYKEMIKGRYRFIKELAGISLGLFVTVPITCHALNWVYPRFMDIFFPNLSGKKKTEAVKNGGEK